MKIGVIGAGKFGKNHLNILSAKGVLAGISELHDDARIEAQKAFGVPVYSDYHELLAAGIDGVVIATPAQTHYSIACDALRAGIPTFVEKPLTLTVADAEALVKFADEQNVMLMVGHLLLFHPAVELIRQTIASGKIGSLCSLHQERLNLGTARSHENALWSLGVHDVAVLLYLVGQSPSKVTTVGQEVLNPGIEDDVYLHLLFDNGIQAHIHNSWLWPELRRRLVVVGTEGMIVFDEVTTEVTLQKRYIDSSLNKVDNGMELLMSGSCNPLETELTHFMECIRTHSEPRTSGRSALEVVRVLELAGLKSN